MLFFPLQLIAEINYIPTAHYLINQLDVIFNIEIGSKSLNYEFTSTTSPVAPQFYEDLSVALDLLDETFSIFHYSVPNITLHYPEPFVATPSVIHFEPWFAHIALFQYWLWFIFMSLIVIFFLIFVTTIRWCNIKHKPVRETRGVSRSKCGDLITSSVPITWAISILIHESNDAIENSDGYGTSEFTVGIRAYQWGWEYYYPNDEFTLNPTLQVNSSYFNNTLYKKDQVGFKSDQFGMVKTTDGSLLKFFQLVSVRDDNAKPYYMNIKAITNRLDLINNINSIKSTKAVNLNSLYTGRWNLMAELVDVFEYFRNHVLEVHNTPSFKTITHECIFYNFFTEHSSLYKYFNHFDNHAVTGNSYTDPLELESTNISSTGTSLGLNWISSSFTPFTGSSFKFTPLAGTSYLRWVSWDIIENLDELEFFFNTNSFTSLLNEQELATCSKNLFNLKSAYEYNCIVDNNKFTKDLYYGSIGKKERNLKLNDNSLWNFSKLLNSDWILSDISHSFFLSKFNNYSLNLLGIWNLKETFKYNIVNFTDIIQSYKSNRNYFNNPDSAKYMKLLFYLDSKPLDISSLISIQTFEKSLNKIFKSSIDESRSFVNPRSYDDSNLTLPFIDTSQTLKPITMTLSKTNKLENYEFVYIKTKKISRNCYLNIEKFSDLVISKFPFSVSSESDLMRHLWFDWYSPRRLIITKSIDTSKYNLFGKKNVDFTFTDSKPISNINNHGNFLLKYFLNRKLISKSEDWVTFYRFLKFNSSLYLNYRWSFTNFTGDLRNNFSLIENYTGQSRLNLFNKFNWITRNSLNSFTNFKFINPLGFRYFWNNKHQLSWYSDFINILLRRDYLYLKLVKKSISDINPSSNSLIFLGNPNSKDFLYNNLSTYTKNEQGYQSKLHYKPIRKGISNMIRIQSDRAIALPTDVRIQILAVSKDIIHSWSIPSAGVKIDCIPGYSSHRVVVFNLSGLYWGQCMEICGRFHHWMPIVVYFLKRDLFCLWCTHFLNKNYTYKIKKQPEFTINSSNYWSHNF